MSVEPPHPLTVDEPAPGVATKVVRVGNSLGLILTKDVLAHLKVEKGDSLFVVEAPDGIMLSPYDPAVSRQIEAGKRFMKTYRETFRALAK